jgi:hypothetical protein
MNLPTIIPPMYHRTRDGETRPTEAFPFRLPLSPADRAECVRLGILPVVRP